MGTKILVIGSVNGKLKTVFEKLCAAHKKNPFTLLFIVGDLFGDPTDSDAELDDLLRGHVTVPCPTYFALGKKPLPPKVIKQLESKNDELCENLYFIGKRTVVKTLEGIRVVALGGALNPDLMVSPKNDPYQPFYSVADANSLRGSNTADVLLTSEWPERILEASKLGQRALQDESEPYPNVISHQCIAKLCDFLKPRYHFSFSPKFFEREPFFHQPQEGHEDKGYAITRFISLAPFGAPNHQKWSYFFSIDLTAPAPLQKPIGTTISPIGTGLPQKRSQSSQGEDFSRFSKNHPQQSTRQRRKKARHEPPGPSECFFCLTNHTNEHLITCVGAEVYMTTAKGPISTPDTFPGLSIPAHMQIIPIEHNPTISSIPDPEGRQNTITEMIRFRTALNKMLLHATASSGQEALGSVTWELSRSSGVHTIWQFLPVPAKLIAEGLVEAAFRVEAENEKYPQFETSDDNPLFNAQPGAGDSFNVWIWSPPTDPTDAIAEDKKSETIAMGKETVLVLPMDYSSFRFDMQFGRRVLAKLLGLDDRTNWRQCEQSAEDETRDAKDFNEAFKEFDFTLAD